MNLFIQYLKQKRWIIIGEILFLSIFFITFALYKLPLKAVIYPALLCLLLEISFALADFIRIKHKYDILRRMQEFTNIMLEALPSTDGIVETAYQDIICTLSKEHSDFITNSNLKYTEMLNYYTVWAHQIKTPIASMRLTLQNEDTLLSRGLSNDLFRIEQYVEMVLTFLRLDSKSTDYVIKEYSLDNIIKQSVRKFAGEFISRKLSLVYEPLNSTVITDEKWLSFVIEQVLSNALKYTPSGSITITLEPGQRLCIRDTGIGIAAEDLPRIFENGFTGYNGRTDKKASGIGLYLCKSICEKLGHGIKAESTVDTGTTIILDLSNHYVSVSSMLYRMKRNGAGLASICILSTMVLVMMLGAGSLFFGAEDSLRTRYPKDIIVSTDFISYEEKISYTPEKADNIISEIEKIILNSSITPLNTEHCIYSSITGMISNGNLTVNPELVNRANTATMENVAQIFFIPLNEYNSCLNTNETLQSNEVLIYYPDSRSNSYPDSEITLADGTVLKIKKQVDAMIMNGDAAMEIIPSVFIVVNDIDTIINSINSELADNENLCRMTFYYGLDTNLKSEAEIKLANDIRERIRELDYTGEGGFYSYGVQCRESARGDFYGSYGGIFYLGIILSIVFISATVLIIYYKQITEGYEDESRFAIMQKIGMTKEDIRKSINSQMLTIFFLPLLIAVLHLSFAFPMIQKILVIFNLRNVPLMITVLAVSLLVFGCFYAIVYKVTSNVYYTIVSGKQDSSL